MDTRRATEGPAGVLDGTSSSANNADGPSPPRPFGLRPAGPLAALLAPYIPQRVCSSLAPCQRAWGPAAKCKCYSVEGPKRRSPSSRDSVPFSRRPSPAHTVLSVKHSSDLQRTPSRGRKATRRRARQRCGATNGHRQLPTRQPGTASSYGDVPPEQHDLRGIQRLSPRAARGLA